MSNKIIFGGLICALLLGLYAYLIFQGIAVINCSVAAASTCPVFTATMDAAFLLIGGLVSALVISELAITKPGESPGRRLLEDSPKAKVVTLLKLVTTLYLIVWLIGGLTAFIVGYLQHPGVLSSLENFGQTWLGLVVAAAYAYLGIQQ